MSLLYECIDGIIQGGILGSGDDASGRDDIAELCVNKLRGMVMIDGDPNRKYPSPKPVDLVSLSRNAVKYVALLAFNKIVITHPWLVAQQEDVLLECIDSTDISIRIKALDLVQGMVSSDNLVSIVSRLMRQLRLPMEGGSRATTFPGNSPGESDDEDMERNIDPSQKSSDQTPPLPDDYRIDVISRILKMCSQSNYSNLTDFDWYIDILTQLIRTAPQSPAVFDVDPPAASGKMCGIDISESIGNELRNIAVKVQAVRHGCVQAAEATMTQFTRESHSAHPVASGALKPLAWLIGEFASELLSPEDTLNCLLQLMPRIHAPEILASCIQATLKVFTSVAGDVLSAWTAERKSKTLLLMARVIDTLEKLALHPNLEVQERAVEFTELLKLTAEAASAQEASSESVQQDAPRLLTQAIPSLFAGWELNSVAPGAQKNVPITTGLDLDMPINSNLNHLLASVDSMALAVDQADDFEIYYHQRPPPTSLASEPAAHRLIDNRKEATSSYQQQPTEESYLDADILAKRKAERKERNRDDPFYISEQGTRSSTPIHNILQHTNGADLDVDSIPIMELDLDKLGSNNNQTGPQSSKPARPKPKQKIVIAADEQLGGSGQSTPRSLDGEDAAADKGSKARAKKLLGVNSTNIGSLSLEGDAGFDPESQQREEAEMAQAMKEVEMLRLEMQRANERIQVAQGVDAAGTVVKKKKVKKTKPAAASGEDVTNAGGDGSQPSAAAMESKPVKVKKKKKKVAVIDDGPMEGGAAPAAAGSEDAVVKPKKKKKPATKKKAAAASADDDSAQQGAAGESGTPTQQPEA